MDKQTLIRDMKQSFNGAGLLTPTQIALYVGLKWEATRRFLEGIEYASQGKKKLHFVGDVAQRILDRS